MKCSATIHLLVLAGLASATPIIESVGALAANTTSFQGGDEKYCYIRAYDSTDCQGKMLFNHEFAGGGCRSCESFEHSRSFDVQGDCSPGYLVAVDGECGTGNINETRFSWTGAGGCYNIDSEYVDNSHFLASDFGNASCELTQVAGRTGCRDGPVSLLVPMLAKRLILGLCIRGIVEGSDLGAKIPKHWGATSPS
jgi:hypothetical protein